MQRPTVIGLGELLWDVFPDSRRPGGAPANVAYHAGQLGAWGVVASRVGDDPDGRELREFLEARELDTSLLQADARRPTGRVTVSLSPTGQPSYVIHEDVAWEYLQPAAELLDAMSRASAVCFGTLAQRTQTTRETIHRCLIAASAETLVVYDVNLRQRWYQREWIEASLQGADVVKLNDEELGVLAPLLEAGDGAPSTFADAVRRRFGVGVVCLTRGAQGCWISGPDGEVDIPGTPVKVADTVGAGDAFTAGLITGLLAGRPLEQVGRFATRIGGLVASRAGAMPSIATEAAELRESLLG